MGAQGRRRGRRQVVAGLAAGLLLLGVVPTAPAEARAPSVPRGSTSRAPAAQAPAADDGVLLYSTEGNRLRRYDLDTVGTGGFAEDVLVERAADGGRDINGEICFVPDGSGRFLAGEDTGQPSPPPGWGLFAADGTQVGKLTATYAEGGAEPFGCEFAPDGTLFTSEVGFQGFGTATGQLMMWFPPYDTFPGPPGAYPNTDDRSTNFCKLATDLGTAGAVTVDAQGRVYVAQSSGVRIDRFSPPFPTGPDAAGGCGRTDATGAPVATTVQRETFVTASDGMLTFSGLTTAPNGNIYAASVFTGRIAEYDLDGNLVRLLLAPTQTVPPIPTGNPQGLAVGPDGTVYYADLDLVGTLPDVGPGPDGRVWRIRFDATGDPLPPEVVRAGLAFPDGLAIAPGNLEPDDPLVEGWPTLAGGPERRFFNPDERWLTADTADELVERWRFPTGAVVTASPSIATVPLPGGGSTRAVFAPSWDGFVYAVDWDDGSELWRFAWEDQPGASFPAAASVTVADVGGRRTAFVGAGEHLYALDASTGTELWRFAAGTGCRDASGRPPGLCSFDGERNQVETTPIVSGGTVYFGMDVNDVPTGKGGFYAVDAAAGTLVWYFDVETGSVCRPDPGDETGPGDQIRRFDGYHSEAELGLPAGFFASRSGCGYDRTPTGCGNVWSSAAHDQRRGLLYFGTSNCDTDDDPTTPVPPPPMPRYDEALVVLRMDGTPAWTWRPREVDNDDLAFGAVPNLFTIDVDGEPTEVVGIGSKDGTYYVLDRDGRNESTGVSWDDPDPRGTPYWSRKVVPGGEIGGIIATASVDQAARRVLFSTAPGEDVVAPQRPTVHALDLDTGAILWQNTSATSFPAGDASYASTSGVPGVAIVGSVITPHLRLYDTEDGTLLLDRVIGEPGSFSGIASGAAVLDGTLVVGTGIGARSSGGSSPGDFAADTPSAIVALCVPGAPGCAGPPPVIAPQGTALTEGDAGTTTATVPVRLSRRSSEPVTVRWETIELAGQADRTDVVAASGTVTFAPGQTEASVAVEVRGDRLDEADEYAVLRFFEPTGARLGGLFGLGIVQILDDDPPPTAIAAVGVAREGDGPGRSLRIPVVLSAPSGRPVEITWRTEDGTARAPGDYTSALGTLVLAPGQTRGTLVVPLAGDARREGPEWFGVRLTADGARLATTRALAIVLDDD